MEFIMGFIAGALVVVAVPKAFNVAADVWARIRDKVGR